MFRSSLRLPLKLLGIPVRLDVTFLLVLPLFAYLIGSQIPGYVEQLRRAGLELDPSALQQGATPWILGSLGAIGLFASVVVHELGHAVTARLYGVKVREITLWFLGGVAQFDAMPRQRGAEAVVGIAGPATSLLVAFAFALVWRLTHPSPATLFVISYLTVTNVALAAFNLLPALPLDGGRVLRSLLALAMPHVRATRVAGSVSAVVAVLLGVYGFLSVNIFLVVIAFFVYNAGRAEIQAAIVSDLFEGQKVRDLMTREPITVSPDMRLDNFAQMMFFRRHAGYPVVDDAGRLLGFARLQDAREASESATVGGIMVEADTIAEDADAMDALTRIAQGDLGRLAVVDASGRLVGMLSKTDLVRRIEEGVGRGPWPRAGRGPGGGARPQAS